MNMVAEGRQAALSTSAYLLDAIIHAGARRRKRVKAYYICRYCDNQFLFNRPLKTRECPVCRKNPMHKVSLVDEFEISRMNRCGSHILVGGSEEYETDLFYAKVGFLLREDISDAVKSPLLEELRGKGIC